MASDRENAIRWAGEMVANSGAIYLDTETTGLDDQAEIVEIAVLDNRGTALLNTLVRPNIPIPEEATAIHGLTDAMVREAPPWPDVYPYLAEILRSYPTTVIYNAEFDARIIRQVNRLHGLPVSGADWQCAMRNYASYAGVWHPKWRSWRWHRLTVAATALGHAPPETHRALTDAAMCRAVVHGMAAALQVPT